MAKKISELPVVDTAQAADKVLINHDGTTSTILVEDLLPVEAELDDIPTAGSSNAVTSGGVYTALQSAGSIPDWDENGETAVDFIKNRPFYREVVSSTTVFSITGSDARTTSTNGTMDFTESYSASELLVVGKEYRVIIYHASATFEERIIASKYNANNIRLTGSAFYIEQNTGNLEIKAAMSCSAFGSGSIYFTLEIIEDTFSYTKLPEEYLDTSFAAPEFSDTERVSGNSTNYEDAYMLLFRNGAYYRNKYADAFTDRLTDSGIMTRISDLENSANSILESFDSFAETISSQLTALKTRMTSVEQENSDQADLISELRAQIQTLQGRITYLESLHAGGDVIITEADNILSLDGEGVSVVDGELVINSANVSVSDGVLNYGIGSTAVMSIGTDGTLSLDGNGVSVENGNLDINSDDISVRDEVLITGEDTQEEAIDGTVDLSGAVVDEAGVCDLGETAVVEDEVITM